MLNDNFMLHFSEGRYTKYKTFFQIQLVPMDALEMRFFSELEDGNIWARLEMILTAFLQR